MSLKLRCAAVFSLLMISLLVLPLSAEKVEEVPNPRQASLSFVVDSGSVLAADYVTLIDGICRELQARTTIELAVVTVGDLGGLDIAEFAEMLFRRFAIGVAGRDNGLLLLCSRDDRMVRLEVGYGLEASIPDARASRLLDTHALPQLKSGQFGRGLFLAVRDIAAAAAAANGVGMVIAEPTVWPAEAVPPAPLAQPTAKKKKSWDPEYSSILFASGLLALAALGLVWTWRRFNKARGKAARAKAIGAGITPTILVWIAAVIGFFLILVFGGQFLTPLIAMLATPGLATAAQLFNAKLLRKRLATYRLPCAKCEAPMEMIDDSRDDHSLSVEEQAEEKAGGMDYEFWHCPKCGADEKLTVKLDKAAKCPQCGRRALTSSTATLSAATREQGGRERVTETCLNPKCNYTKTSERSTPRLAAAAASSSGPSRPTGSFGGGRSGGAGASRKF